MPAPYLPYTRIFRHLKLNFFSKTMKTTRVFCFFQPCCRWKPQQQGQEGASPRSTPLPQAQPGVCAERSARTEGKTITGRHSQDLFRDNAAINQRIICCPGTGLLPGGAALTNWAVTSRYFQRASWGRGWGQSRCPRRCVPSSPSPPLRAGRGNSRL